MWLIWVEKKCSMLIFCMYNFFYTCIHMFKMYTIYIHLIVGLK